MSLSVFDSLLTLSSIHDISQRLLTQSPVAQPLSPQAGAKVNYSAADSYSPTRSWDLSAAMFSAPSSAGTTSIEAANAAYAALASLMGGDAAAQGALVSAEQPAATTLLVQQQNAGTATPAQDNPGEAGVAQSKG